MNAHELIQLIWTVEQLDFEDLEDDFVADVIKLIPPSAFEEIGDALRELQARRKAAGDEHGIEVPS